jgi:hypothetical protein
MTPTPIPPMPDWFPEIMEELRSGVISRALAIEAAEGIVAPPDASPADTIRRLSRERPDIVRRVMACDMQWDEPPAPLPSAEPVSPKPKRKRKPSTARLIATAKELGVDVTVEPDGTATFRTSSRPASETDPEIELKKWIAKHAN